MNKEQQIKALAGEIFHAGVGLDGADFAYKSDHFERLAIKLYNAGYRKQSDTVKEFAEKVEFILSGSFENAKAGFNLYGWSLVGMSYSGEGVGIDKAIRMIEHIAKEYGVWEVEK